MIPKKIHYIWYGKKEEPEILKSCLESWKKVCPSYEIIRWDESNFDVGISVFTRRAREFGKYAYLADYARMWIIYTHGGIYLDVDIELIKPFNKLLEYEAFFSFQDHKRINLGNGFGAKKENVFLLRLMQFYDNSISRSIHADYSITSPEVDTPFFVKNGLVNNNKLQIIDNCIFLPNDYMSPKSFYSKRIYLTSNTISIHHFDGTWVLNKSSCNYNFLFFVISARTAEKIILFIEKVKVYFNSSSSK